MIIDELIKNKFKLSEKIYQDKFTDEDYHVFLAYFDIMNMYSLFPRPLSYLMDNEDLSINEIKNKLETTTDTLISTNHFKEANSKFNKLLSQKIQAFGNKLLENKESTDKIRYFFSYEVVDYVMNNFDPEYVTTAWLKCYEILEAFQIFKVNESTENDTINYFGICEQPGAFLYCINHYVKTKLKVKNFNFIVQSLNPAMNRESKIFRAESELFKEYRGNYDYGSDNTGDITKLENIKHYRTKYYNKRFDIITADCGLDCSDDFAAQESNLVQVILGQFLNAIGLASLGTNYFFKLFSIYETLTAEIIYLANLLFEKVHLVRVLKTKITSGEIYCVCNNFKFEKSEMEPILEILYNKYNKYNKTKDFSIINASSDFLYKITSINKVLLASRLTSMNFMYFRKNNFDYADAHPEVKKYIKELVDHYVKYFCNLYMIEKLKPEDKLVTKKFTSRWSIGQ